MAATLYERLTQIGLDRNTDSVIPIHQFMSALGECERGQLTRQQVIDAFALTVAQQAELDALTAKVLTRPESYSLGARQVITNIGTTYDATPPAKGLGFIGLDTLGITRLEMRVRYNKIGTGTLTWQLWNETDGTEIGFVDDAAAAGDNKTISLVVTPANPLGAGVKLLRPRVKSTVATDDPEYYGACLFLRRVSLVTSSVLHEVLLLSGIAPYTTIAAIKTRLGV